MRAILTGDSHKAEARVKGWHRVQHESSAKPALRVTFQYAGERISVLQVEPVDAVVPPSDPLSGYEGHSGFWVTVADEAGHVLYRRILNSPVQFNPEVHQPATAGGSSRRTAMSEPSGTFTVLLPHFDAASVELHSSPHEPARFFEPAHRSLRVPLVAPSQDA